MQIFNPASTVTPGAPYAGSTPAGVPGMGPHPPPPPSVTPPPMGPPPTGMINKLCCVVVFMFAQTFSGIKSVL